MVRYLERLVARAGISNDAVAATPRPPSRFDSDTSDPFEAAAEWTVDVPKPATTIAPPVNAFATLQAAPIAQPADVQIPVFQDAPQVRVEEHWSEQAMPLTVERTPSLQSSTLIYREVVQEAMQPPPVPQLMQGEIRTETIRTEAILDREVASLQPPVAAMGHIEEPGRNLDSENLEEHVLNRLMPALDAWFRSGIDTAPEQPRSETMPVVQARPPETEQHTAATLQSPQLVIGSILVEVASPAVQSPVPAQRIRTVRSASPRERTTASRLGFGLGQM